MSLECFVQVARKEGGRCLPSSGSMQAWVGWSRSSCHDAAV